MEKSSDVRRVREQREPLYVEVKEAILELARTQCGPDRRLPSEEELCRLLGVSRATVREALSILCREGFVSKRHGIGNLVNRSVLDTPMRFDLERGLRRMLEDAGYQASTIREMPESPGGKDILLDDPTLPVRLTIPRPWKIQRTAHLVEGAQAIVTCNVFTSNGSWNGKGFAQELAYTDVINLLSGGTLSQTVMAFLPWCAGKGIASAFGLAPGTPIILWHELNYGIQDTLLCESVVAFNPDFVTLRALHRW